MNPLRVLLPALLLLLPAFPASAHHPTSLDYLLQQVQEANARDSRIRAEREAAFLADNRAQKEKLRNLRDKLKQEKARSERLKQQFSNNEQALQELDNELKEHVGILGELFGTVRQSANDLDVLVADSLVSIQFPGRATWFNVLATARSLPDLEELERFWLLIKHEIEQSGKVSSFTTSVIRTDGTEREVRVTRVGTFNVFSAGHYLTRLADENRLVELSRQPPGNYRERADALEHATTGYLPAYIDPTRGALLKVLVQAPTIEERIHQGGLIGYIILSLGAAGLLLAGYRLVYLLIIGKRVRSQLAHLNDLRDDNPLGRVLRSVDTEAFQDIANAELALDEAILRETPGLTRGQAAVKLLAAVAPLLGLLGTVTGMILTFQSISLFGTGDPKLMAGGISQALITTVLGLVTAIPLLFSHNLISARSRELIQILDEQSAGLLARGNQE